MLEGCDFVHMIRKCFVFHYALKMKWAHIHIHLHSLLRTHTHTRKVDQSDTQKKENYSEAFSDCIQDIFVN